MPDSTGRAQRRVRPCEAVKGTVGLAWQIAAASAYNGYSDYSGYSGYNARLADCRGQRPRELIIIESPQISTSEGRQGQVRRRGGACESRQDLRALRAVRVRRDEYPFTLARLVPAIQGPLALGGRPAWLAVSVG